MKRPRIPGAVVASLATAIAMAIYCANRPLCVSAAASGPLRGVIPLAASSRRRGVKAIFGRISGPSSPSSQLSVRGGGGTVPLTATTETNTPSSSKTKPDPVATYRIQQQLYLQSRSLQLRQALIDRGLDALSHSPPSSADAAAAVDVDWDCALATLEHPKSCLYTFDAQPGTKVIAPLDTTQWITLSALNRLRRQDVSKVEPLWHNQYHVIRTWFSTLHPFSVYAHLPVMAALLSMLLDHSVVLGMLLVSSVLLGALVTMPAWQSVVEAMLLHPLVWRNWPQWARFVHAALPLQLLLAQLAYKGVAILFGMLYGNVRAHMVELECAYLERYTPLTIVENDNSGGGANVMSMAGNMNEDLPASLEAALEEDDELLELDRLDEEYDDDDD